MRLFMIIVLLHFSEHIAQMTQLYALHWDRVQCLGLLGLAYPWLMRSEIFHYAYALIMLIGLGLLPCINIYWKSALIFQAYHHYEHALLLYQAVTKDYLFDKNVPTSLGQLLIPKIELHFIYNLIVMVLMGIAVYIKVKQNDKFKSCV